MKSRHQSKLDFLRCLEVETICARIRREIYPKIKDKEYYANVIERKRAKIENLAQRNDLGTIYTNPNIFQKLYQDIVPYGLPKFVYSSESQRAELQKNDLLNYYSVGADFKINGEDVGKVTNADNIEYIMLLGNGVLSEDTTLEIDGSVRKIKDVRRIL